MAAETLCGGRALWAEQVLREVWGGSSGTQKTRTWEGEIQAEGEKWEENEEKEAGWRMGEWSVGENERQRVCFSHKPFLYMVSLKYQKPAPFVQMSPEVSRICNDNGCLSAESQCEENPSFFIIKPPSLCKEKAEDNCSSWQELSRVFILMCTYHTPDGKKNFQDMGLTIKMMACSITILASINLTSILSALWYFPRQSDPSPLTPQLWPHPA